MNGRFVPAQPVASFHQRRQSREHSRPKPRTLPYWADTGTSTGRLMIAVLGGLADAERDLISTRTAAEGRSRAKAKGSRWADPRHSPRRCRRRSADGARDSPVAVLTFVAGRGVHISLLRVLSASIIGR
jgi:DNA invertase Pin-like site-specific DNA recombinase